MSKVIKGLDPKLARRHIKKALPHPVCKASVRRIFSLTMAPRVSVTETTASVKNHPILQSGNRNIVGLYRALFNHHVESSLLAAAYMTSLRGKATISGDDMKYALRNCGFPVVYLTPHTTSPIKRKEVAV